MVKLLTYFSAAVLAGLPVSADVVGRMPETMPKRKTSGPKHLRKLATAPSLSQRMIVVLDGPSTDEKVEADIVNKVSDVAMWHHLAHVTEVVIVFDASADLPAQESILKGCAGVLSVEADSEVHLEKDFTPPNALALLKGLRDKQHKRRLAVPNDPRYQWSIGATGTQAAWDAYAAGYAPAGANGARDIVVGVIDTGVDYNHEDLVDMMWTNPNPDTAKYGGNGDVHGINAVSSWDVTGDPMDDNNHGTHCAGIIAAEANNGLGIAGVAGWTGENRPGGGGLGASVKIMALKFLSSSGSGSSSGAIVNLDYAIEKGAHMTSNSWGGSGASSSMKHAIERANELDQLFVVASGNSNADAHSFFPCAYAVPNMVCVGSLGSNGAVSSFSNYGFDCDIMAPGGGIMSTIAGGGYASFSGTSMACPFVSGVLALMFSYRNSWALGQDGVSAAFTAAEAKKIIYDSTDPLNSGDVAKCVHGKIQVDDALARTKKRFPLVHKSNKPQVSVTGMTLTDSSNEANKLAGSVQLSFSGSPDFSKVLLQFRDDAGTPVGGVAADLDVASAGSSVTVQLPATDVPFPATHLAAYGWSANGGANVDNAFVLEFTDIGTPAQGPGPVWFPADTTPNDGLVKTTFRFDPAAYEATVDEYNYYLVKMGNQGVNWDDAPVLKGTIAAKKVYTPPVCISNAQPSQGIIGACGNLAIVPVNHEQTLLSYSGGSGQTTMRVTVTGPGTLSFKDFSGSGTLTVNNGNAISSPTTITLPAGESKIHYLATSATSWNAEFVRTAEYAEEVSWPEQEITSGVYSHMAVVPSFHGTENRGLAQSASVAGNSQPGTPAPPPMPTKMPTQFPTAFPTNEPAQPPSDMECCWVGTDYKDYWVDSYGDSCEWYESQTSGSYAQCNQAESWPKPKKDANGNEYGPPVSAKDVCCHCYGGPSDTLPQCDDDDLPGNPSPAPGPTTPAPTGSGGKHCVAWHDGYPPADCSNLACAFGEVYYGYDPAKAKFDAKQQEGLHATILTDDNLTELHRFGSMSPEYWQELFDKCAILLADSTGAPSGVPAPTPSTTTVSPTTTTTTTPSPTASPTAFPTAKPTAFPTAFPTSSATTPAPSTGPTKGNPECCYWTYGRSYGNKNPSLPWTDSYGDQCYWYEKYDDDCSTENSWGNPAGFPDRPVASSWCCTCFWDYDNGKWFDSHANMTVCEGSDPGENWPPPSTPAPSAGSTTTSQAPGPSPTTTSKAPAPSPTTTTSLPTANPTKEPTAIPTKFPTGSPTKKPTDSPTKKPTGSPTKKPTDSPTKKPTDSPTKKPTDSPTKFPTDSPTKKPTDSPTKFPTDSPTPVPTKDPTQSPTNPPTPAPTCPCENGDGTFRDAIGDTCRAYEEQKRWCVVADMFENDDGRSGDTACCGCWGVMGQAVPAGCLR